MQCTNWHTLPRPTPSSHLQDPHNLKLSLLRRCAKDISISLNILEVSIIYLHVYLCQYMRFRHLWHVPRLGIRTRYTARLFASDVWLVFGRILKLIRFETTPPPLN